MSSSRAKASPTGIGESPTPALTDGVVVVLAGVGTDDDDVSACVGDGSGRRLVTVGLLDLVVREVDDSVVATSPVACAELDRGVADGADSRADVDGPGRGELGTVDSTIDGVGAESSATSSSVVSASPSGSSPSTSREATSSNSAAKMEAPGVESVELLSGLHVFWFSQG